MYKRILVAVDGSSTSDVALAEALKLAKESAAQVLLLHVCENPALVVGGDPWMMGMPPVLPPEIFEERGQHILDRAQEKARVAGVEAELRRINDAGQRIGQVIAQEAKDWNADLIVMGTHGRKGLDHLLLGSVAEGVIRTSPVPVLLVRGVA